MTLKTLKINGTKLLVPDNFNFRKARDGEYIVSYNDRSHYIIGGKKAGGRANEWFVDGFGGASIPVSGPVEAVKLILGA